MSRDSGIEWTDHTFNPWWGCVKVAQGCKNCYAETFANRYGHKVWGPKSERRFFGVKHWNEPIHWNDAAAKAVKPAKVFCGSMCDVCEDRHDLVEPRKRLRDLIERTHWLRWQLLTKRPENFGLFGWGGEFPANVWVGASAAQQDELDRNVGYLNRVDAVVRFLSLEPLIGPIDLGRVFNCSENDAEIHWVIVGGESGPGARPFDTTWLPTIIRQCRESKVPLFIKQLGARPLQATGLTIGMREPLPIKSAKGGDMGEWEPFWRIREFPEDWQ